MNDEDVKKIGAFVLLIVFGYFLYLDFNEAVQPKPYHLSDQSPFPVNYSGFSIYGIIGTTGPASSSFRIDKDTSQGGDN